MEKAVIYCNKGLEDVCAKEVKRHIKNSKCEIYSEIVILEVPTIEDICVLAYKMQSACRVCLYIGKNMEKQNEEFNIPEFIINNKKLAVRAFGFDDSGADTQRLAVHFCKILDDKKIKYFVDLKNPDIFILFFKSDDGIFFGIDFSGDLNKRDYLIFTHNQALRPTISYSLLELCGFKGKGVILDPFCGNGAILVEAVLKEKKGIHFFDFDKLLFHRIIKGISYKEPNDIENNNTESNSEKNQRLVGYDINLNTITSARKNAKIAGINKDIEFSVVDCHFLDTKFDTKTVDYIVTHPPMLSKKSNDKKILHIWDDFLFIGSDILKKRMLVILNKTEEFKEIALKYNFKIVDERKIFQGETPFFVLILEK
jgi:23S rRNA G2445 N2-methylase RlmL